MALRISAVVPAQLSMSESLEAAKTFEGAGLHRVWITENLFTRGAFALAGAVAAQTSRIRIGIGTVSPYLRHPAILAMEALTVQELSGGRFGLGLGPGALARLASVGQDVRSPLGDTREAFALLRSLLDGQGPSSAEGRFTARGVALEPPDTARHVTPLYAAASGPKMLRLAGAVADGLLLSLLAPRPLIAEAVEAARAGAAEAGRDPDALEVIAYVPVSGSRSEPEAARARACDFLAENVARFVGNSTIEAMLQRSDKMSADDMHRIAEAKRNGEPLGEDVINDDLLREFVVAGDPEECAAAVAEWAALGITEIALAHCGGAAEVPASAEIAGHLARVTGSEEPA
ncbi:LLM class flavin-dependent oxidoreductase [Streptosporangium sp. NPDC051022]|uniref:LLM class flavin-dependent oxidoreductase n=1 Tax=Streptosporangium sp. NPDC051022 TaxID=3155752 RepID=UPI003412E0D9